MVRATRVVYTPAVKISATGKKKRQREGMKLSVGNWRYMPPFRHHITRKQMKFLSHFSFFFRKSNFTFDIGTLLLFVYHIPRSHHQIYVNVIPQYCRHQAKHRQNFNIFRLACLEAGLGPIFRRHEMIIDFGRRRRRRYKRRAWMLGTVNC